MPIYIGRSGQKAEDRRKAALEQERTLSQRRASLLSGDDAKKKREALNEYATLHNIRKGVQKPPVDAGAGYGEPSYDRTARCWKSYAIDDDGRQIFTKWKAWCVNVNKWLSSAEYEISRSSR
jgi:hypothetical protein